MSLDAPAMSLDATAPSLDMAALSLDMTALGEGLVTLSPDSVIAIVSRLKVTEITALIGSNVPGLVHILLYALNSTTFQQIYFARQVKWQKRYDNYSLRCAVKDRPRLDLAVRLLMLAFQMNAKINLRYQKFHHPASYVGFLASYYPDPQLLNSARSLISVGDASKRNFFNGAALAAAIKSNTVFALRCVETIYGAPYGSVYQQYMMEWRLVYQSCYHRKEDAMQLVEFLRSLRQQNYAQGYAYLRMLVISASVNPSQREVSQLLFRQLITLAIDFKWLDIISAVSTDMASIVVDLVRQIPASVALSIPPPVNSACARKHASEGRQDPSGVKIPMPNFDVAAMANRSSALLPLIQPPSSGLKTLIKTYIEANVAEIPWSEVMLRLIERHYPLSDLDYVLRRGATFESKLYNAVTSAISASNLPALSYLLDHQYGTNLHEIGLAGSPHLKGFRLGGDRLLVLPRLMMEPGFTFTNDDAWQFALKMLREKNLVGLSIITREARFGITPERASVLLESFKEDPLDLETSRTIRELLLEAAFPTKRAKPQSLASRVELQRRRRAPT